MEASTQRIVDICGRNASLLTNDKIRVVIEDHAGMTPELSYKNEAGFVNTHLIPPFRGSSCTFDADKHQDWGIKLAHELAGNWPCFPQFGNPSTERGYEIPPCGHTANADWNIESIGTEEDFTYLVSTMGGKETADLHYRKYDILLKGHAIHYQVMKIRSERDDTFQFGGAWHNTTGQPFLEKGCRLSASADLYHTPVVSHDPEQNERLQLNKEFSDLKKAPLKNGGTADISIVPGMIGYTDFLTGRIPQDADLGWMSVVNPNQNNLYLTFFKGPANLPEHEFTFYFNHIWLQYGGRNYKPWARYEGGVDQVFALGVESAVSAWGYGLDYSDKHPELMGNPTSLPLLPGEEKTLFHATMIGPIGTSNLDEGIEKLETTKNGLKAHGINGTTELPADSKFERIEQIVSILDKKK